MLDIDLPQGAPQNPIFCFLHPIATSPLMQAFLPCGKRASHTRFGSTRRDHHSRTRLLQWNMKKQTQTNNTNRQKTTNRKNTNKQTSPFFIFCFIVWVTETAILFNILYNKYQIWCLLYDMLNSILVLVSQTLETVFNITW